MDKFIDAVTAWPVIVQGVLGSAIFWLILLAGQFATKYFIEVFSKHSKNSKKSRLINELCKLEGFSGNSDANSAFNITTLVYRSLRPFYKGLMWLCLGLTFQSILPIGNIIGLVGCLFYLLKAYEAVSPLKSDIDHEKEIAKVMTELSKLDPRLKTAIDDSKKLQESRMI